MPHKMGTNEGVTAQQANDACRAELDAGTGPLIDVGGCVAGCDSSAEMIAARGDGEPATSVDSTTASTPPTTTADPTTSDEPEELECSDECSRRFTICSRNQQELQGRTPAAAFDRCRTRIDLQRGWLARACNVGCASTDEMLGMLSAR